MKKNIRYSSRLFIGVVAFFISQFVVAQTSYLDGAQQNVLNESSLQYETCKMVSQSVYNPLNQKYESKQIQDPACVARNNQISASRSTAVQGAAQAASINEGNSAGLKAPIAPTLKDCGSSTGGMGFANTAYFSCQQSNANLQADYNYKNSIYNNAKNLTAGSVATKSDQDLYSNMDDSTATGGLDEIQKKNEDGMSLYDAASKALAGLAAFNYAKAAMCKGTCPEGCCPAAPAFQALGAAYTLLNGQSNKQSDEHEASAYQACTAYNQLSSTQKSCGPPPSTTTKYTRPEGCTSINVADCPGVGNDIAGLNGKQNNSGASSFISPELNKFAEVLPDGSVKTSDGKIFNLSDFKDAKSLMAKGLTAAQATALLDSMNAKDGVLAKAGLDAKGQLKNLNYAGGGSGDGGGGGTKVVDINAGVDSGKLYKDKLKDLNDDEKNRKPSSEGLAKEFNGELIGVANDDIFLMMNRRYKRIGDQDTLISP